MSTTFDTRALTEQLDMQTAEANRIAATFKVDEKGRFDIASAQYNDYKTAVNTAKEIKSLLDSAGELAAMREFLDAPVGRSEAASDVGGVEFKSLGDAFVESADFRKLAGGEYDGRNRLRAQMEGKSIFNLSGGSSTVPSLGQAQNLGIAEQAKRKFHIRDLFPKSTTKMTVLYGVRETGWTNAADQVPQRNGNAWGKAAKSDLTLTSVLYPVAEVAHTLDAHKNILSDEPRLKTFINTRMVEGVKYREDFELLHGTGGAEKVTGIFNTTGVQEYTGKATDKYSIQVRRAITRALLAEYDPTGLVISPEMWEAVEIETDDNGAFRVAVQVAIGAEKRVWRLNVVETTAMADENFLIGSFGMGAQLHDRESVSVSVSSENGTNFEDGVVSFRADERVALEVPRPESFVVGSWTAPTP